MRRVILAALCAAALLGVPSPAGAATNGQLAAVLGADTIVAMNPDGTSRRTLWQAPTWDDWLSQLTWSPDGNKLAFVHWDREHGPRIAVTDVVTGQTRYVSDHPGPSAAGVAQDLDPGWTPDGRVLFRRIPPGAGGQPQQAFSVAADGSDLRELPDPPDAGYGEVLWLADGSGFYQLWSSVIDASLSPDDAWIAYDNGGSRGNIRLLSVEDENADDVDLTPLKPDQADREPGWSPDGASVVYVNRDYAKPNGPEQLRIVDVSTHAIRAVADGNFFAPAWQPCVAGVTASCVSPAPPSCTPAGKTPVYVPAPPPCVTNPLPVPRPVPRAALPSAAPNVSYRNTPRLDRHGRVTVKLQCDRACTVTLRITVRLRGGRVLNGKAVTASTPKAQGAITLKARRAKLPRHGRIASAHVVGTAKGVDGRKRTFTLSLIP